MGSLVRTPRRLAPLLLGAMAAVVAALLADSWAFTHLAMSGVDGHDWGRFLRVMGFLPLWLAVGLAAYLSTSTSAGRRGALLLVAAPTLSGGLGEVLKLLVRRERPVPNAGAYVFRSFTDHPFSTRDLGMPSTHAIVAFAAAAALARLWPRARLLWFGLAAGCALTRVMSRAHFLSDVVVAAIVGCAATAALWRGYAVPAPPGPAASGT